MNIDSDFFFLSIPLLVYGCFMFVFMSGWLSGLLPKPAMPQTPAHTRLVVVAYTLKLVEHASPIPPFLRPQTHAFHLRAWNHAAT